MAIIDMKRGDSNIIRAYRGTELIFERGDPYICIKYNESSSESGFDKSCIPVTDLGELSLDYTYEVDWKTANSGIQSWTYVLIGGTYQNLNPSVARYRGLYVGIDGGRSTPLVREGMCVTSPNGTRDPGGEWTTTTTGATRHTMTITYSDTSETPKVRTDGGFSIFDTMDFENVPNIVDKSKVSGNFKGFLDSNPTAGFEAKVYRISIYNGSTLLMNFLPKVVGGHKGMIETVSGNFYPCNDDNYFEIGID